MKIIIFQGSMGDIYMGDVNLNKTFIIIIGSK